MDKLSTQAMQVRKKGKNKQMVLEEANLDRDEIVVNKFLKKVPKTRSKWLHLKGIGKELEKRIRGTNLEKQVWIRVFLDEERKKQACMIYTMVYNFYSFRKEEKES